MASNNGTVREVKTRLTVEGEKQLKQALAENASEAQKLKSDMSLLTAEYEGNTDSQDYLVKKNEILQEQYANARKKVELYEERLQRAKDTQQEAADAVNKTESRLSELGEALTKACDKYGEASEEAEKLRQQIAEGNAVLTNQRNKLTTTTTALNKMETTTNKAREGAVKMGKAAETSAKQLGKTEKAVDSASASGDVLSGVLGDLTKKFGVDLPDGASAAMSSIGVSAGAIGLSIGVVTAAIKAAVEAMKAWVDNALEQAEWASVLEQNSEKTGIAVERFQALQLAASEFGVEADKITDSCKDLGQSLAAAADSSSDEAEAFRQLGISIKDSHGQIRESGEVWEELIEKLGKVENSSTRAELANKLIGESYYELSPILENANKYFSKVNDAQASSATLSEEQVDNLTGLNAQYKTLQSQLDGVQRSMASQSAEGLADAMERLGEIIESIGGYLVESGVGEMIGAILENWAAQLELIMSFLNLPQIESIIKAVTTGFQTATKGADALAEALNKIDLSGLTNGVIGSGISALNSSLKGHAAGTPYFKGGETLVGEYGPERVILPEGSRIQNANDTASTMGGATVYNTINISVPDLETLQKVVDFYSNYSLTMRKG